MSVPILENTGINYSAYYNLLNFFKTIMNNHPSIQTVTQGDIFEIDDREFPAYPLGNVLVTAANIEGSTTSYTVQLTIADKIKLKNNESEGVYNKQTIPYFGTDDTVDIHANTFGIINDITAYLAKGVANFEIDGNVTCDPFKDKFDNGLAGWVATFDLVTHNDRNRCLFFLVNPSGTGYKITNCSTNEVSYATLATTQSFSTNTTFLSTWPASGSCYTINEIVSNFDNWNYINLPLQSTASFANCVECQNSVTCSQWSISGPILPNQALTIKNCDGNTHIVTRANFNTGSRCAKSVVPLDVALTATIIGSC